MTLRRLHAGIVLGGYSLAGGLVVTGAASLAGMLGGLFGLIVLLRGVPWLAQVAAERRLLALSESGDATKLRCYLEELTQLQLETSSMGIELFPRPKPHLKILARAALAAAEKDWQEAARWLAVLEGDAPERLANARAMVGAALLGAGQPAEAAPLLEQSLAAPGRSRRQRAVAEFHLGEAMRQLGRIEDAQAHYQRVLEAHASGPLGRQARDRVKNPPPPYR